MVDVKFYDEADDSLLKFAVIIAKSAGKWVFCKHRKRNTYEIPGGHREPGEMIDDTARRELYEETGATDYTLRRVCVYSVTAPDNFNGEETFGMLYYADVFSFEEELHSEIEKIILSDQPVNDWTYPLIQPKLMEEAFRRGYGSMHHNFLFDLDQTLLDFHASEYKALGIVLTRNGLTFSDEIYRAFKAYNKSLWLELEKGTITRTELFTKRFLDVFSRCEGDSSGLDPLAINDEFIRTMSVNGVLMDGALDFVKRVKNEIPDARIYIASNGATVNAKGRIASTGLGQYIDDFFISEDMGVTKPDAAFFDICLERIGEPAASCIMIGDSLSSDMLGAKNAALDSVWFMPSGDIETAMKEYDIDYCAASFDELLSILKKWSGTEALPAARTV